MTDTLDQANAWQRQVDRIAEQHAGGLEGRGLLRYLLLFGRDLRRRGVRVNTSQALDLLAALDHVNLTDREDFYWSARAVLVTRRDDLPRFDEAFDQFWRRVNAQNLPDFSKLLPQTTIPPKEPPGERKEGEGDEAAQQRTIALAEPDAEDAEGEGDEDGEMPDLVVTASPDEVLRHKDFAQFSPDELSLARQIIQNMTFELGRRRTRRWRSGRGRRFDLRRSIRKNTSYGGELVKLAWREPKIKTRPLVVIADISGSMEQYSRLLLHFIHTLYQGMEEVEAFVFGTRLTRITHELRSRDVDLAVSQVAQHVQDWAGGTRIGESLHTFNFKWGRRVLSHGAVVLIISDGWDRGEVGVLRGEMDRLQRSCYRLIWLNPLLGMAGYQPLTRGIQAALPYIDDFLPVHSLHSLSELGKVLSALGVAPRPGRRQNAQVTAD